MRNLSLIGYDFGTSAAKLIDECGLKGFTIGGASVSLKHSGFIVNLGGATEKDFNDLIALIKKTVFDKFSVRLTGSLPSVRSKRSVAAERSSREFFPQKQPLKAEIILN